MVRRIRYLPHKHEGQSSNPQSPHKAGCGSTHMNPLSIAYRGGSRSILGCSAHRQLSSHMPPQTTETTQRQPHLKSSSDLYPRTVTLAHTCTRHSCTHRKGSKACFQSPWQQMLFRVCFCTELSALLCSLTLPAGALGPGIPNKLCSAISPQ